VTLTVSATPKSPATAADFSVTTNKKLTIAAGSTTSTGTVTITAVNNTVDNPDKSVTVSATASGGNGVSDPANQTHRRRLEDQHRDGDHHCCRQRRFAPVSLARRRSTPKPPRSALAKFALVRSA
jgi:hypothetical protein